MIFFFLSTLICDNPATCARSKIWIIIVAAYRLRAKLVSSRPDIVRARKKISISNILSKVQSPLRRRKICRWKKNFFFAFLLGAWKEIKEEENIISSSFFHPRTFLFKHLSFLCLLSIHENFVYVHLAFLGGDYALRMMREVQVWWFEQREREREREDEMMSKKDL